MSDFHRPVSSVITTAMPASDTAKPAASADVLAKLRMGRHTIEITATANVYIGNKDVTTSNGRPIVAGESLMIPVDTMILDQIYVVGGAYILSEYF